MDLFNKKLSFDETLQFDSLIENGTYDPHLIICASMMQDPNYIPTKHVSDKIMHHLDENSYDEPSIKEQNKNNSKNYIRLPNATITKHKYKYQQSQNE